MEALGSDEEIDQQYRQSIDTVQEKLGITCTYFLPPFQADSPATTEPPSLTSLYLTPSFSFLATYFRPPYGTLGARTRQSLSRHIPNNPTIVMWTIDVEDWLWGTSPTPEKQLEAFKSGVDNGGDLVVLHYLYESTVGYLREMVRYARATGKRVGTVEGCMVEEE
jgi:peptidoglycan/xylan/chitin deacetylase (PgdA/CDA1 family)